MIEDGKKVKVHYKGTLADGSVFDSSEGRDPLEFELGSGQVIAGFEQAVRAMETGDTQSVEIPCAEAYGETREDLVAQIPRTNIPDDIEPELGLSLQLNTPDGVVVVRIVELSEETVTLDGNHQLAGQDLTFELTLVGVE